MYQGWNRHKKTISSEWISGRRTKSNTGRFHFWIFQQWFSIDYFAINNSPFRVGKNCSICMDSIIRWLLISKFSILITMDVQIITAMVMSWKACVPDISHRSYCNVWPPISLFRVGTDFHLYKILLMNSPTSQFKFKLT